MDTPTMRVFEKNGIPFSKYKAFFVGMLKNFGGWFFPWKFVHTSP